MFSVSVCRWLAFSLSLSLCIWKGKELNLLHYEGRQPRRLVFEYLESNGCHCPTSTPLTTHTHAHISFFVAVFQLVQERRGKV